MKTIVISNRKGGSAKTTTAVNLSTYLARSRSVLLIDLDTQGHASIGVGRQPLEEGGSHALFQGASIADYLVPTVHDNLMLLPANLHFDAYDGEVCFEGVLLQQIEKERLRGLFEFCIIDTAPTYDSVLKNSLEVADCVIIPVVPHPLGVVGVEQMFRAIYKSTASYGKKLDLIGILPVMYNPHIQEHKESLQKIISIMGKSKVFDPIGVDGKLASQFRTQTPVVLEERRSRGARDYERFTQSLLDRIVRSESWST